MTDCANPLLLPSRACDQPRSSLASLSIRPVSFTFCIIAYSLYLRLAGRVAGARARRQGDVTLGGVRLPRWLRRSVARAKPAVPARAWPALLAVRSLAGERPLV